MTKNESTQPQLPPRPQRTEDGNGDKKHYQADAVDSFITALEAENESLKAQLAEWLKQNGPGGWIDNLRKAEAERVKMLEVIREFYSRTGIIDNGKCAVCRHGYRSWKLPSCKVPSGPCSNEDCLSRKADALLSKEEK